MANNRELSQLASFVSVNDSSKTISFGSTVESLNIAGVVTATTFSGNVTGNVIGDVTGVINTTGVGTITRLEATDINVSGVGTITRLEATDINVSGASTVGIVTALDIQDTNTNLFISNSASSLSGTLSGSIDRSNNIAIGQSVLQSVNGIGTIRDSIFIGSCTGAGITDGVDTRNALAIGHNALRTNGCVGNIAIGNNALCSNTTGDSNLAVGLGALRRNTTGNCNVAFNGLPNNTIGRCNSSVGNRSLRHNETGNKNTALGRDSLFSNLSGSCNTGVGAEAGYGITTGSQNTALGYQAGYGITTGSNNLALGYNAGNDAVLNFSASVAMGATSNIIVIGNNSHTKSYIKIDWTVTSDERDKNIIGEVPFGLEFVQGLEPIKFQFKNRESGKVTDDTLRYGFKAQQVAELEGEPNVIADVADPENLKVTSAHLVPVLVNAIKELSAKVAELEARLDAQ